MTITPTARRQPARLTFEDGEVVVTPRDRDVFLISAEKATEACREAMQLSERIQRFESEFLIPLHHWCVVNANRVRECYIPLPSNQLQVFVVTNSRVFDLDLAEKVAELELKLSRSGWRVGVCQLPEADEDSLATFFSPEGALEVYAERRPASEKGGS